MNCNSSCFQPRPAQHLLALGLAPAAGGSPPFRISLREVVPGTSLILAAV